MNKIVYSTYDEKGGLIKEGTINGVAFSIVWENCQKEADEYFKEKLIKKYSKGIKI